MSFLRTPLIGSTWRRNDDGRILTVVKVDANIPALGAYLKPLPEGVEAGAYCDLKGFSDRYTHVPAERVFIENPLVLKDLPRALHSNITVTVFADGTIADTKALNARQAAEVEKLPPLPKPGQVYRRDLAHGRCTVRLVTEVTTDRVRYTYVDGGATDTNFIFLTNLPRGSLGELVYDPEETK